MIKKIVLNDGKQEMVLDIEFPTDILVEPQQHVQSRP